MIALRFRRPGLHALALALVLGAAAVPAAAQPDSVTVRVAVSDRGRPVTRARVQLGQQATRVDRTGTASFRAPAGRTSVGVTAAGYVPWRSDLFLDRDTLIAIPLREVVIIIEDPIGLEEIVVTATRSEQRIEDAPVRVEVLAREEVEEKMLMTPGDVAMMLNETSGLRVQTTSPSLGGANVRVQGLRGRYTQVLSDGLPLYGGQSGSLGLLQIPPMDLRQVEVIKGAASALYGSSALGGVVNLVSRLPEGDRELLLNATTLGGADAVLWSSAGSRELGYTLLAGLHRQWDADVDGDGWADVPAYRRAVIRPRLFWADDAGRSAFATLGATLEEREGGGRAADGTVFPEELGTRRVDAGLAARWLVERGPLLNARASGMMQRHAHAFGPRRERDRHATWFGETSAAWTVLRH
ncbi:MAG TPA: TonB-dependent receptor plug domain-containing protein, partial [Longimicrobium sp.]|nr:TonB-dependent receptor plug domain-containing protein [Longimicrobium sp.]